MIEFEGVVLESESAKAADIWDGPGLRCLDVPVPGVTARISVVGKRAHVEVDLHAREALQWSTSKNRARRKTIPTH